VSSPLVATVGFNAVVVAVTAEVPRILTVTARDLADTDLDPVIEGLPFGRLDSACDRTLELGLRRSVAEQSGLELGYVEQLYTFGDLLRDRGRLRGGRREISVGYLALVREGLLAGVAAARWRDGYEFLPWEDWRDGRPAVLDRDLAPAVERWVAQAEGTGARVERRERAEIVFGLGGVGWDGERVLERYELLYEMGLVEEAWRDRGAAGKPSLRPSGLPQLGRALVIDHRRILATALGRLRGKLRYRPVVFELVPPTFTLLQLQKTVEALAGVPLHKGNFRRLVENGGLVEGTGALETQTGGRPAEIFRFRREVLRERPAPGVGLPGLRLS
jgi:hypothetical protein